MNHIAFDSAHVKEPDGSVRTALTKGDTVYMRKFPTDPVTLCWFEQQRTCNTAGTPWVATADGPYPINITDIIKHEPGAAPDALERADSMWSKKLKDFSDNEARITAQKESRHRMATRAPKRTRTDALPDPEPHHHDAQVTARLEAIATRLDAALTRIEHLEAHLREQQASQDAQLTRFSDTLQSFQAVLNIRLQQVGERDHHAST